MFRLFYIAYGFAAYLAFFVVILYAIGFVSNFAVPKGIDGGAGAPLAEAILVNLLLMGLFAVQHSVMARPGFKRAWTRIVPEPIERSTYVLLSSAVLALLFWQWRPMPGIVWSVEGGWGETLLWVFYAAGWGIVFLSSFMIGHFELFGLKQVYAHVKNLAPKKAGFMTPGFYRLVRHPLMTGFLVAFWATPEMTWGHLLFALGTTGYILIALQLEERDLTAHFGDEYRGYKKRVPMLIPGLKGRR